MSAISSKGTTGTYVEIYKTIRHPSLKLIRPKQISKKNTSSHPPKMTLIHIVLLSFKPEVTQEHKDVFVREVKKFKHFPFVKDGRLIVGGPSLTNPIKWSKGYELALISYHENLAALEQYETSTEYHRVTSTYMFPFAEDFCRFDFEVDPADEYMCAASPLPFPSGKDSRQ